MIPTIHERESPPLPSRPVKPASTPCAGAYDVLTLQRSDRRGLAPDRSQHVIPIRLLRCTISCRCDSRDHQPLWKASTFPIVSTSNYPWSMMLRRSTLTIDQARHGAWPQLTRGDLQMGTMMRKSRIIALMMAGAAVLAACHKGEESGSTAGAAGGDVKVGILHSLSGTMAISEVTVKNATQMAIDEINAAGGVLGKKISAVVEDGASDPAIF